MAGETGHDDFGGVLCGVSYIGDRVSERRKEERENGEDIRLEDSTESGREGPGKRVLISSSCLIEKGIGNSKLTRKPAKLPAST
jgi:hypothetical protein